MQDNNFIKIEEEHIRIVCRNSLQKIEIKPGSFKPMRLPRNTKIETKTLRRQFIFNTRVTQMVKIGDTTSSMDTFILCEAYSPVLGEIDFVIRIKDTIFRHKIKNVQIFTEAAMKTEFECWVRLFITGALPDR